MKEFVSLAALALAACATVPAAPAVALGPQEVSVAGPDGPLAGTLIEAGAKTPALLILPGSAASTDDAVGSCAASGMADAMRATRRTMPMRCM